MIFGNKNKNPKDPSGRDSVNSAPADFASLSKEAQELRRLNILLDLLKTLNSVADLETLLVQVVDSAIEVTGAERGFLMLLENPVKLDHRLFDPLITPHPYRKPKMEFRVARSKSKTDLTQANFKISMTVANRVAEYGQTAWVRDAQSEGKLKSTDSVTNLDLRTILCVPLKMEKEVTGVLYVDSRFIMRTFTEEDLVMFEALAEHAGRAIGKSRLYEDAMMKAKVEQENKELLALDRKKSDFINVLAHELRTPLTVIQGYSERIKSGKVADTSQMTGHAGIIFEEAKRLSRMVDELLDLSRVRSGKQQIERSESDLAMIVERAVQTLTPRALSKQQQVSLEVSRKPFLMQIDSDKIYQLMLNLIDNAMKYTSDQGVIEVRLEEIPAMEVQGDTFIAGFAQVSVKDNGIGIAPEDQERVFDEFYRTAKALKLREQGTGLGLSICRGIVQAHGGRIWVESKPERGSKFVFTLPNYQPIEKLAEFKGIGRYDKG